MFISKFQSFARSEGLINYNRSDAFETKQKLICLFLWFITFRFLFAVFTSDPTVWAIIGDPYYYTKDRVMINMVFVGISMLAALLQPTLILSNIYY